MIKESDYNLTLKKLYEEHKLLVSSLFEILITGIPILSELDDKEFQKMLILFSDYYLA